MCRNKALVFGWLNGIKRIELQVLMGLPSSGFWAKQGFTAFTDRRFLELT